MFFHFSWLPPEINSARMYSGAGSGSLHAAAAAWQRLAQDLQATASSFQSVISGLVHGQWGGPASLSMAAAAAPLTGWLTAAAAHAQLSSGQTRGAAAAYESAFAATVHPAAVAANRILLATLVNTNFLGQMRRRSPRPKMCMLKCGPKMSPPWSATTPR
ncbi:PPE family protein [Mycobacterium kansasii 732]|nr:PPE family protein [Mycobacterium kansasii 732]